MSVLKGLPEAGLHEGLNYITVPLLARILRMKLQINLKLVQNPLCFVFMGLQH